MDVSTISSSTPPAQPQRSQQADVTQAQQPVKKPERSEADQAREAQAARNDEQKKPQPVVNAQGQTTGRIVNVSA